MPWLSKSRILRLGVCLKFRAKISTWEVLAPKLNHMYILVNPLCTFKYGIVTWSNPKTDALAFQVPDFETWSIAWRQAGMTESGRMACAI